MARAWESLTRRAARQKESDRRTLYRRLGGYLSRQGFSADVVHDALERFFNRWKNSEEGNEEPFS
jgi:SOS response regulatory protein OraA/RecX